ncbi:MAG: SpoIIE family protein phosphatase [Phycisphaerae bacterium]|jgi:serine phosphatase RsbU (regulator of sigma subunit)
MATTALAQTDLLFSFTDVIYLTSRGQMPGRIRKLLRQRKLSYLILTIPDFARISHRLNLIGTVIIDPVGTDISHPGRLAKIIESLEQNNIGVILLDINPRDDRDVDTEQINENGTLYPVDLDELWIRISVNLAYRKQSPGMVVRPATPPMNAVSTCANRLADQLKATEAMVNNISEQMRLAGLVQRDFLPKHLPNTEKFNWATVFSPAEWVSGDIYDINKLDEKHIGFFIADAVGHSVPAALLTIFIKQSLVMRQDLGKDYTLFPPADVIKNLNLKMTAQKLSGYQFATCCYCLLDTETLELVYARAGHPYPILIRDNKCSQLEIRGSLLGVFEQAMYKQQSIRLQSGDKLILYSDGADPFVGAFDDKQGFIYNDQFLEFSHLPLTQMFHNLNELAQAHQLNPSDIDDITIVGLEIL